MSIHADPARFLAGRTVRLALVGGLFALTVLPVGEWLNITFQRGRGIDGIALAAVALTAMLFGVISGGARGEAFRDAASRVADFWDRRPVLSTFCVAALATLLYVAVAWTVFGARPLLIDELVQVFQARTFVSGRLWLPLDPHPEFRAIMHMVEQDGRWYSQFPPGGPAMLAFGELVHAPWLVNPVFGGISVAAFGTAVRWSRIRPGVALSATVLFAFAPFVVFQSASHMNHVTSLAWLLIAAAALVRATSGERDRPVAGLACGIGLGVAASIRPLDAAAWALPAAVLLAWRAMRDRHWRAFVLSGVGVAIPMLAMFVVNRAMTGNAFQFGYTVLWGPAHGLGFHESPWGEQHTLLRGLSLTSAYLNGLNEYVFEWPALSLLPAFAALCFGYVRSTLERFLLIAAGLVVAAYFAYWHSGFFLGPRFMYPVTPIVALLTAQLPGLLSTHWKSRGMARLTICVYVAATTVALMIPVPRRAASYGGGFQSMRWDYDAIAREAGAAGGVILVRESWGSQVIQRLWALGVSRSLTEVLYRNVDTCGLDDMATQLERSNTRGAAAEERLRPLLADSARVVLSTLSPDDTERVLPGSVYPPSCMERIEEDRGGYTLFGPMLLARDSRTRWIRDLHARDTLVITPRELENAWIMRRATSELAPVLERLNVDSVRRAWHPGN